MTDAISVNDDGVKLKPEIMEKEKLYHCVFNNKIILAFKDHKIFLIVLKLKNQKLSTELNLLTIKMLV